ncbi:MAG TPA: TolC family protein, partial [Desulfobacteraceae bacterium]|nr:TolC family protein [Desulfobacteraceae bacterium]
MPLLILLSLCTGCITPEKWQVYKPDALPVRKAVQPMPASSSGPGDKAPGPEEDALNLSVENAVLLALENNRDLRIKRLNPVIAGLFEQIEQGAWDPELFTTLAVENESDPDPDDEESALSLTTGIRQKLPWGTTLEGSLGLEDVRSGGTPPEDSVRGGLSVTQALLRGAGPSVNLAAIHISHLNTLASRYELEGFALMLVGETEIAYWNYVLAQKEHTIVENALAVSKRQQDEVRARIEVGILPDNELAAASAEVARQEQALISSRNQVADRRMRLLHLFHPGSAAHLDRPVTAVSSPYIPPVPATKLSDRIALALATRPELKETDLRLRQGRLDTMVTRNGILPRLDFFIDLGINGYGSGTGRAVRNIDDDAYDVTAGLSLSLYLNNRAARARHRAAVATLDQAELARENLAHQVELEVRLAAEAADTARKLIAAARATREFEEQTVQAEIERFKAG